MSFDLDRIGGRRALDALIDEILGAGGEARRTFEAGRATARLKPDRSPVTSADEALETRLRTYLDRAHPTCGFLGEESGASREAELTFVLDPIDGTRAFMRGLTTWSVLLALLEGERAVLGIAYLPAEDELYVAVDGSGAYGNGRPLRVSSVASLDHAAISHGSLAQFAEDGSLDALARFSGTHSQRGLTDFDGYRRLLRGQLDAVIDPGVKIWDIAAASVLVREAGGQLTDMLGVETLRGRGAVATNGAVHTACIELLQTP